MPNRPPQKTVREGQLNKTLENFNAEVGIKVAETLHQYHVKFIEPRLAALEAPFWRRWWNVLKKVVELVNLIRPEKEPVAAAAPPEDDSPEQPEARPPSEIEIARPRIIRPDEL